VITPAEADLLVRANLPTFLREDCPLAQAHGRVLRADLTADRDLPPYDRVTMDGYALRADAVARGVTAFTVQGTQAAGMRPLALEPAADACVEVMTGAVLPAGADAVVPYEQTTRQGDHVALAAGTTVHAGDSVHRRGSDHPAGDIVVRAGCRLTGGEIAVAAAVGAANVTVAALPRIALVATGDELVEVEHAVAPHQTRRSNDYALRAALVAAGYPRVDRLHLRDVRHEVNRLLRQIFAEHDVVILSGGISKGKFDLVPAALEAQGIRPAFQGVAQRPGKPFWFGATARRIPVFALPGNPVSAYTCLHRYVIPALDHASGLAPAAPSRVVLDGPTSGLHRLTRFVPVSLTSGPNGELRAAPAAINTSGDFAGLVGTDGFVELPPGSGVAAAGTVVEFRRWR
jgi:molybdopterin molybdotransferase